MSTTSFRSLRNSLGPLEKQSETAKEYLKKKEELKTFDINMFLLEEERLRETDQRAGRKSTLSHPLKWKSQTNAMTR